VAPGVRRRRDPPGSAFLRSRRDAFHRLIPPDAGDAATGEFSLSGNSLDIARYIPPTDPASEPFVMPTAELKALRVPRRNPARAGDARRYRHERRRASLAAR
jgi:hypothetical protein